MIVLALALLAIRSQIDDVVRSAICLEDARFQLISCVSPPPTWVLLLLTGSAVGLAVLIGMLVAPGTRRADAPPPIETGTQGDIVALSPQRSTNEVHTQLMQSHQRRILGRIADEIASYHDGRQSMVALLNNAWGLFEAAELRDPEEHDKFMALYYALSSADDANQPWMPAGLGSDENVREALAPFEAWTTELRDGASMHEDSGAI